VDGSLKVSLNTHIYPFLWKKIDFFFTNDRLKTPKLLLLFQLLIEELLFVDDASKVFIYPDEIVLIYNTQILH